MSDSNSNNIKSKSKTNNTSEKNENKNSDTHSKLLVNDFLREVSKVEQKMQINKINKAFKLDPIAIFDLNYSATIQEIDKQYRTLSLFVHPDKCKDPLLTTEAKDAFSKLAKARKELLNAEKRSIFNGIVQLARINIAKRHGQLNLNSSSTQTLADKRHQAILDDDENNGAKNKSSDVKEDFVPIITPEMEKEVRAEVRQLLIDREQQRRQLVKLSTKIDGRAAQEYEERAQRRKQEQEARKHQEDTRDTRVSNQRNYQKKVSKVNKNRKRKMPDIVNIVENSTTKKKVSIKRMRKPMF